MVFNAKSDGFSDVGFVKAMARVSANGQHAYTESQLYYAVAGSRTSKGSLITRMRRRSPQPPDYLVPTIAPARFQENLAKWLAADGAIQGRLLMRHDISSDPNRAKGEDTILHSELTAHGFDRVVVVENAPTAVMLVANNFHIDHRCAILSEDGYPEGFYSQLIEILNRNPALVVAAVHGISVQGLRMAEKLRSWFPHPSTRIIDVGLRPGQGVIGKLAASRDRRKQPDQSTMSDPVLARLDPWEREWLAWGLTVRLDALTPQQLMMAIGQVFAKMAQLDEQAIQAELRLHPTAARRTSSDNGFDPAIGDPVLTDPAIVDTALTDTALISTATTETDPAADTLADDTSTDITTVARTDNGDGSSIEHDPEHELSGRSGHEHSGGLFWWDHYQSGEGSADGLEPSNLDDHSIDSSPLGGLVLAGTFDGDDLDGDG